MFSAAAAALLVTLALALARALLGPTVFDRVLAMNTIGTVAVLLLAVIGFLTARPEFLDLAIVYGLLNVVGTIAVLKFFRHGDLGDPGSWTSWRFSQGNSSAGVSRPSRRHSGSQPAVGVSASARRSTRGIPSSGRHRRPTMSSGTTFRSGSGEGSGAPLRLAAP